MIPVHYMYVTVLIIIYTNYDTITLHVCLCPYNNLYYEPIMIPVHYMYVTVLIIIYTNYDTITLHVCHCSYNNLYKL